MMAASISSYAHHRCLSLQSFGATVELREGVSGMVPIKVLRTAFGGSYRKKSAPPAVLDVKVLRVDAEARKILLNLVELSDDAAAREDFEQYLAAEKSKQERQAAAGKSANKQVGSFGDLLQASFAAERKTRSKSR